MVGIRKQDGKSHQLTLVKKKLVQSKVRQTQTTGWSHYGVGRAYRMTGGSVRLETREMPCKHTHPVDQSAIY